MLGQHFWYFSPLLAGDSMWKCVLAPPALKPKIVTLFGFPPNCAILSRTQRSAATWSFIPLLPGHTASSVLRNPVDILHDLKAAHRVQPFVVTLRLFLSTFVSHNLSACHFKLLAFQITNMYSQNQPGFPVLWKLQIDITNFLLGQWFYVFSPRLNCAIKTSVAL